MPDSHIHSDSEAITPAGRERLRALFAQVAETCDLPPLPAVATRALMLARDPETRAEELAALVATDQAIAARVLQISRSISYVRREPARTLRDAIVTVGFRALRRILIAASARSLYRVDDALAARLWEHSLATALAADELASVAGESRGGDAFIAGLLHDVGKVVLHLSAPDTFSGLARCDETTESATFGVTHAAVGGCLAEIWGLENRVVEAIMFHHRTPDASPLVRRVATADRIAYEMGYGSLPPGDPAPSDGTGVDVAAVAATVMESFAAERSLFD